MKRLQKVDEKVHFIKEVGSAKPKILVKTKINTYKMKNINKKQRQQMKIPET